MESISFVAEATIQKRKMNERRLPFPILGSSAGYRGKPSLNNRMTDSHLTEKHIALKYIHRH